MIGALHFLLTSKRHPYYCYLVSHAFVYHPDIFTKNFYLLVKMSSIVGLMPEKVFLMVFLCLGVLDFSAACQPGIEEKETNQEM